MRRFQETRQSGNWLLLAIIGSLLLHGLVMLLSRTHETAPAQTLRSIRLVSPEPLSLPEPAPLIEQKPEIEALEPGPVAPTAPAGREIVKTVPEPGEKTRQPPVVDASTESFSQHILASVRQLHGQIEPAEASNILQAQPIPALPDQPGWLNDYVGSVKPSLDQWQNSDGSRETRMVLANGQVICGRAQAPTVAELFNPQFALNIMTFRHCGRERPKPIDRTDPWQRGGPDTGVE